MKALAAKLTAWGPLGVFLLAVLDSAGIPLPAGVDLLLVTTAVFHPESAWLAAGCAVVGSLIGTMFLYWLARQGGRRFLDRQTSTGRARKLRGWFNQYGLVTVFIPALVPIPMPMKVPVICCGAIGVPPLAFAGVVLLARIPRYLGLAYLGRQLGENSTAWLKQHALDFIWVAAGLAAVLFAAIKVSERYQRTHRDKMIPNEPES